MGKKRIKPFISGEGSAHYRLVHRSQRDPLQADEEASKMVLQVVPKYLKSANSLQHSQAGRVWQGGEEEGARYFDPVTGMEKTYEEDESPDYDGVDRDDGEYSDDEDEEGWEDEEGGAVDGEGWETDEEELEQPADSTSSKGKAKPTEIEEDKIGQAPLYGIFLDDREYDYTKHLKPIGESTDAVFVPAKTAAPAPVKRTGGQLEFKEEKKAVRFEMPEGVLPSAYEEEVGLLNRGAENKSAYEFAGVSISYF
jgi:protein LTV1